MTTNRDNSEALSHPEFVDRIGKEPWQKTARSFAEWAYWRITHRPLRKLAALPREDREDIIQIVICHFIENECRVLKKWRSSEGEFEKWFSTTAFRRMIDRIRIYQREQKRTNPYKSDEPVLPVDAIPSAQADQAKMLEDRETIHITAEILRQMKTKCQLLLLARFAGFENKEIGVLMGFDQNGHVKASNDLNFCLKKLRTLLNQRING